MTDLLSAAKGSGCGRSFLSRAEECPIATTSETASAGSSNTATAGAQLLVGSFGPSAATCSTCRPTEVPAVESFRGTLRPTGCRSLTPCRRRSTDSPSARTVTFPCLSHTQVGMRFSAGLVGDIDRNWTRGKGSLHRFPRVEPGYSWVDQPHRHPGRQCFEPVYGPRGAVLKKVLSGPDTIAVYDRTGRGWPRHSHQRGRVRSPGEITFCGNCHDVNLLNGFRWKRPFRGTKN